MEKPVKVEIGSRWLSPKGQERVVTPKSVGETVWFDSGTWAMASSLLDPSLKWTYLGSDTPSPPTETDCVSDCVRPAGHIGGCVPASPTPEMFLPPVTPPKPQAHAPEMCGAETKYGGYTFRCQMIGAHSSHVAGSAVEDGRKTHRWPLAPVYGRMVGEMRAQDGTPLTALQAIQAKKQPEPWVESCDPWHWIKDA